MKQKVILASGYFDPLHVGHIEYLEKAKELGDCLIVIVNNDKQCHLKKGKSFMRQKERIKIIKALKPVDMVFLSIDQDRSVSKSIEYLFKSSNYPTPNIFTNGGDVKSKSREEKICKKLGIKLIYGLGEKIQSSSNLTGLKEIKNDS